MVHHATNIMARWRPLCNRHFIVSGESGESPGEASGKRGRGSRARERRSPGRSLPEAHAFVSSRAAPGRWAALAAIPLARALCGKPKLFTPRAGPGVRGRCPQRGRVLSFISPCVHAGRWFWVVLQESGAFRAMVPGLLGDIPSAVSRSVGKTPGHEWLDYPLRRFRPPKPPRS